MSVRSALKGTPVTSEKDIEALFESGITLPGKERLGAEHERPFFDIVTNNPVHYGPHENNKGMRELYERIGDRDGWEMVRENGNVTLLKKDGASIGFEPGKQSEISGAPFENAHKTARETDTLIALLVSNAEQLGMRGVAIGYQPVVNPRDIPLVPRQRYALMSAFCDAIGSEAGHAMMRSTSTVQVNLDYTSESDFVTKLRVSLALQPVVTALYANSPFKNGRPGGYQSMRSHNNHNAMAEGKYGPRYGFMMPVAFEDGFGFGRLARYYAEEMPIMGYYDANGIFKMGGGALFTAFMKAALPSDPGLQATTSNVVDHVKGIFPEVRPQPAPGVLEMRGADVGPAEMIKALPALWAGLLYNKQALSDAHDLIRDWTGKEREDLRANVPATGLETPFRDGTVQDIAKKMLAIAEKGLSGRNLGEGIYLEPLFEITDTGRNWAVRLLDRFEKEWKGDIRHLYAEMDYAAAPTVLGRAPPSIRARSYGVV